MVTNTTPSSCNHCGSSRMMPDNDSNVISSTCFYCGYVHYPDAISPDMAKREVEGIKRHDKRRYRRAQGI